MTRPDDPFDPSSWGGERNAEWAKRFGEAAQHKVTQTQYHATRITQLGTVLRRAREGSLDPNWREQLQPPQYTTQPHQIYSDADTLAIHDLRELPTAAWEPYVAGGDWRRALNEWYAASLGNLNDALDLQAETHRAARRTRFRHLAHLYQMPALTAAQQRALVDKHHALQPIVDEARIGELQAEVRDRDYLHAWYHAGLAAGGDPVDWVSWFTACIDRWHNANMATVARNQLETTDFRAEYESLPHYWRLASEET